MTEDEVNKNVLLTAYDHYSSMRSVFDEMETLFKNHNTATKVALYAKYIENKGNSKVLNHVKHPLVDSCIDFLIKYEQLRENRLYDISKNAVGDSDDPDFLKDIL